VAGKRIGILALQGCIEPHQKHLQALGVETILVKNPEQFSSVEGLILPGGESTSMIHLAKLYSLWEPLKARAQVIPYWGICAGSILMATEVENPAQESLGVMDLKVKRNAYGRQLESFQGAVELDSGSTAQAVFIRAPKFVSWGNEVKVKGTVKGEPSYLEAGKHMVTAFHPELTDDSSFHRIFLSKIIPSI